MEKITKFLRWSEKYTKTDMVYIFKGGFWLISAEAIVGISSVVILAAFANFASEQTFGAYQFVISFISVASVLTLPGMKPALVRAIARGKEGSLAEAFKARLKWSTFGTFLIASASLWYFFNDNLMLAAAFLVIIPFFQLRLASNLFQAFWEGRKRFDVSLICRAVMGAMLALTMVTVVFLTDHLWILVLVFFATSTPLSLFFYFFSKKRVLNNEKEEGMVGFGKNLTLMNFLEQISHDIDNIALWFLFGPAEVVMYTLSAKPIEKARLFIPIKELALPKLSSGSINTLEHKKDIFKKFLMLFLLTIPAAISLAILAPFLYGLIFPKYIESVKYFRFLSILIATLPFGVLISALVAEMKTKYLYITKLTEPAVKIGLLLILAPVFGIWGVVVALLVSDVVRDIMGAYFFWKM